MSRLSSLRLLSGALAFVVLSAIPQKSQALNPVESCRALYTGPQTHFGASSFSREALPAHFRLLVWNVYKGGRWFSNQVTELNELTAHTDIALLQEAIGTPDFVSGLVSSRPDYCWSLANAFVMSDGHTTGVATGSNVKQLRSDALLSPVREPITNTPKSILLTEYPLENSAQTLLVLNIHAINFVTTSSFKQHIDQVRDSIQSHQGPLIVGGDFNTWNSGRTQYLNKTMSELGLTHVPIATGAIIFQLDHVFIRGINVLYAEELGRYQSSDHAPLVLDLIAQDLLAQDQMN